MAVRCSRATVHWAPPDRRADEFWPDAPEGQARVAAFVQALQKLGWTDGDNVRTDVRWAAADMELFRKYAEELVELNPHVILASASPAVAELQRVTRSVPIVFANVVDPVGRGFHSRRQDIELLILWATSGVGRIREGANGEGS